MTTPPMSPEDRATMNRLADITAKSHSSYWLGKSAGGMLTKFREGSIEYLDQLRTIQRSISSFVKITTGKDIHVSYSSGQQSYTDGKSIVISADANPAHLDSTVGLALHEASHCLLSNSLFPFLRRMYDHFPVWVSGTAMPNEASRLTMDIAPKNTKTANDIGNTSQKSTVYDLVKMVMNVLEDRRIDLWMYQNAPGYQPYYDSMYDRYWHSQDIDAALQNPIYRVPVVDNYMLHVINLTNKHFDGTALPGLDEIRKIANLTERGLSSRGDSDKQWKLYSSADTTLKTMPSLFADACRIVEIMLRNSTAYTDPNRPEEKDGDGESQPGDLPNLDGGNIRNLLGKLLKFLEHGVDKQELTEQMARMLEHIKQTNAQLTDTPVTFVGPGAKTRVVVYRNVTQKVAQSPEFPFHSHYKDMKTLENGIRMGQMLANRIAVIQDESPLVFTRQQSGRLDKRLLSGLGYGQQSVFSHKFVEHRQSADVWLDVDLSGSMQGEKYRNAMAVAVAIAYAASVTRTLNVTLAVRSSNELPEVAILYDSTRHGVAQLRSVIPYIGVSGGTPEGLCFATVKDEILAKSKSNRRFFINLSDGEPTCHIAVNGHGISYGGVEAWHHTRKIMNEFRNEGINVMSYFIGPEDYAGEAFRTMYGADARFVDPTKVNEIIKTLNKLLLS